MSGLEKTLPNDAFLRIHRSIIVAMNKIESFNADTVQVAKRELPIGRLFKQNVDKLLGASVILPSNRKGKRNQE